MTSSRVSEDVGLRPRAIAIVETPNRRCQLISDEEKLALHTPLRIAAPSSGSRCIIVPVFGLRCGAGSTGMQTTAIFVLGAFEAPDPNSICPRVGLTEEGGRDGSIDSGGPIS